MNMKTAITMIALLLSTSVFAASTGTLVISGTVAPINDLSITVDAAANNLNITGGEVGKKVATVSETSNSLTGYSISMRSANGSQLKHTVDSSKQTSYTVSYDGGAYTTLSTSDQVVKNSGSLSGLTSDSSEVKVNVVAHPTAPAGVYSDTITISISAN
jgi:hypothetical protein